MLAVVVTGCISMATPEQIAYRRQKEKKLVKVKQKYLENQCKYILGEVVAHRLRVSGWEGMEDFRDYLEKEGKLDTIEKYRRLKNNMTDDNSQILDSLPKLKRSETFDQWVKRLVQDKEKQEIEDKVREYLSRNKETISKGFARKILTLGMLAEKLSEELGSTVTVRRVQVIWDQLNPKPFPKPGANTKKRGRPPKQNSQDQNQEQTPGDSTVQGENSDTPTLEKGTGDSQDNSTIDES